MNKIQDKIWWTRKARIKAEERLLNAAFHSQMIVFWYSFCSVEISIYYLKNNMSDHSAVVWVVFSVLILSASSFVNGTNYKERASLIKECYEELGGLYIQSFSESDVEKISKQYMTILNACENHIDKDYRYALCQDWLITIRKNKSEELKHRQPNWYMIYLFISDRVVRILGLFLFYTFPIFLVFII